MGAAHLITGARSALTLVGWGSDPSLPGGECSPLFWTPGLSGGSHCHTVFSPRPRDFEADLITKFCW
jgi:hypothetical protein